MANPELQLPLKLKDAAVINLVTQQLHIKYCTAAMLAREMIIDSQPCGPYHYLVSATQLELLCKVLEKLDLPPTNKFHCFSPDSDIK